MQTRHGQLRPPYINEAETEAGIKRASLMYKHGPDHGVYGCHRGSPGDKLRRKAFEGKL